MPIFRPDEYKHGNANLAFLDSDFVRGGIRVVATTSNLTDSTMESKVDQLKDGATLVWVSGSSVFYRLKSKANITSLTNGWEEIDLTGTDGADGADGLDGTDGNTVLSGAGAPGAGTGNDGDFYIDTSNNDIYGPKTSGSWGSGTSLIGPSGANGTDGADGADGADGTNATITGASATGLSAGSTPTVTLGGTASARTFAFGIPAGADGADGADGSDGVNGQDGAAATISVGTVTTGSAGSSATVTNSGTSSAATFDFTIPKGDTGSDGANGQDGADGQDGAAATIAVGSVTTGAAGSSASVTNSGTSSAATFDFTIPKGDTGQAGVDGADGANGADGADGADGKTILNGANAPQSSDGNQGDFWIETSNSRLYGPKGASSWPAGYVDLIGTAGADGADGADGANGTNGTDGADGKTILNGSGAPSTEGSDGDFWIDTTNDRLYGPKASGSWPATYVDLVGPTTFKSFATASVRSSHTENKQEGFLAYLEDTDKLYVYANSNTAYWSDSDQWKELAIEPDEYQAVTSATLLDSSAGDYLFSLYDTTANEFKKFDIDEFFGYIASQLTQTLIDDGVVTEDEITFGSGSVVGDLNGDGLVGTADLLILLAYYGNTLSPDLINSNASAEFNNMTGTHLQGSLGYTSSTWKTIPMNASGFTTVNEGFAISLSDVNDYFDFEDGTVVSLNGTWAAGNNKTFHLGGVTGTGAAAGTFVADPLVFRFNTTAYNQVGLRAYITVVNSTLADGLIIKDLNGVSLIEISEGSTNYDIEIPTQEISSDIAPFVSSDTTDIRVQFKCLTTTGNIASVALYSGGVRLSN